VFSAIVHLLYTNLKQTADRLLPYRVLYFECGYGNGGLLLAAGHSGTSKRRDSVKLKNVGRLRRIVVLVLGGLALGVLPVTGATISGTVTFDGTPPAPEKLQVTKDPEKCGTEQVSEALVIGEGKGIQYVVVSIANAPSGQLDTAREVELDQQGCRFTPHVVVVPAGATLVVRNSDGIMHNLHTFSKANPSINKAQPGFKKTMPVSSFKQPEIIKVQCDMHGWMRAWVVVTNTPYTVVTDAAGRFQLPEVPAGTYTLKFWHETLGETQREVTVKDGETATVQMALGK
jgi:plastocyanin